MIEERKSFFNAVRIYCIYKIYMALANLMSRMIISITVTNKYSMSGEVMAYQELTDLYNSAYSENKYGYAMVYELIFIIILLIYFNKYRARVSRPRINNIFFSSVIGGCLALIVTFALNIVELPVLIDYSKAYESVFSGAELLKTFYVIFFQAIFEEILFRYVLFGILKKAINPYLSSIIISLVFAMEHGNLIWFIYTFIFSIILMIVYLKTNDFLACIVMHISFNGLSVLLGYIGTVQWNFLYIVLVISIIALVFSMYAVLGKRCDYEQKK